MEDTPANKTPGEDLNKLDLSALKSFEFGTEWTPATDPRKIPSDRGRERGRGRPPGSGQGKPSGPRRDRRPSRPVRGGPDQQQGGGSGGFDREGGARRRQDKDRQEFRGDRRDQSRGHHGRHGEGRDQGRFQGPPRPYVSPFFDVTLYPDDAVFDALVKGMRASCRTYELFEIARLILEKPERCVVVVTAKPRADGTPGSLYVSVPDGVPFPTEDEAINHVLEKHLSAFFTTEEVEVDPPRGVFNFVNKCPVTGALLGPPNYHRYAQIVQQHYATHNIRMPFERYKASIEVVKDPDAVAQWLESMKKVTRYTLIEDTEGEKKTFDSLEDARVHLLHACRDRVVRVADSTRVPAKNIVAAEHSEARRAMRGVVEMQRRFPLDTANALRGRLRRENFHLFKRGSKGVSYVCAVRRKFRQPGQVFSGTVGRLLETLDANPMMQVSELAEKLLGFAPPHAQPAPEKPSAQQKAPAAPEVENASAIEQPAGEPAAEETSESVPSEGAPAPDAQAEQPDATPTVEPTPPPAVQAADELTEEQKSNLNRLALDLRWLVTEGYVAEFSDGRLFAHPVMEPEGQGRKKAKAPRGKPADVAKPEQGEAASQAASDSAAPEPVETPPAFGQQETPVEPAAPVAEDPPGLEPAAQEAPAPQEAAALTEPVVAPAPEASENVAAPTPAAAGENASGAESVSESETGPAEADVSEKGDASPGLEPRAEVQDSAPPDTEPDEKAGS